MADNLRRDGSKETYMLITLIPSARDDGSIWTIFCDLECRMRVNLWCKNVVEYEIEYRGQMQHILASQKIQTVSYPPVLDMKLYGAPGIVVLFRNRLELTTCSPFVS